MAAVFNLDDNAFLRSRFQGHAASRVVTKTTQALAQAGNLDGHIVVHSKVWSATNDQFVKHTTDAMRGTTNGLNATIDLVSIFKGLAGTVACTTDKAGKPLPANLSGKVYRNPAYPAIELYDGVTMTGVASSNAVGSGATARYESYEILNGTARVMDWVPPTAVSDGTYPVVPGYTGRVEVCKDATPTASSVWTDLENCDDVGGVWSLDQSNWEFVFMAGMVKFHPDCTPIGKGYKSIRFTGFKYIGTVLSDTLKDLQTQIEQSIGGNFTAVTNRVTALETATADLPKIRTDIAARVLQSTYTTDMAAVNAAIAGKVSAETGKALIATTEITKLAGYPAYSAVQAAIAAMMDASEVNAAIAAVIADYYNKTQIDGMVETINGKIASVFKYKGVLDYIAELPAKNAAGLEVGHVYHVKYEAAVEEGETPRAINSEYVWNGEKWEELGGLNDLSAYYTKAQVDGLISGERTRATGAESRIEGLVTAEATAARAAEEAIADDLADEIERATGEEKRIEGLVTTEADRAAREEARIEGLITDEATTARTAEDANKTAIESEVSRAKGEEQRIEGLVTSETTRATGIEGGLRTDLNDEVARAKGAEGSLRTSIETEANTARAAEQKNANDISAETSRAEKAEGELQDAIDDEATTARAAEQANTTAINNEVTRATDAEARIEGLVTAEAGRAEGEEARIEGLVTAEASRAKAAEQDNAKAIADETTAREAAVASINTALAGKSNVTAVQYLATGTLEAPQAVNLAVDVWYIVKAPFIGTLPTAPADGAIIKVSTLVGGDKRRLVAGEGDTILGSNNPCAIGITEDGLSLDTENYVFLYDASAHNWVVL
jgi:hypothetical protein